MPNKAIVYILAATLSFAIMNVMAKALSEMHFSQVVFCRSIGTLVFIFPYMLFRRISIVGKNPLLLSLRSILGLLSLSTFFLAIQLMPLGSAISIRYIGPIFGAILAFFYLKEKVSSIQWLSLGIAFSGVIILKGFDIRVSTYGFVLAMFSAFFLGFVFILIRYLATREHYLTIINYFMTISVLGSLFFVTNWRIPNSIEWPYVLSIGIFGLIGQVFMTKAFSMEKATILAPFKYMEIVYALIMAYIFWGEKYNLMTGVGMVLIVGGMILNVISKDRVS